jgi:hypothetical protein
MATDTPEEQPEKAVLVDLNEDDLQTIERATLAELHSSDVQDVHRAPLDGNSALWAAIAGPFAYIIFGIITLVLVLPFFRFLRQGNEKDLLDWSKTILAPVIGFGSAVVGYFFGTRSAASSTQSQPGETRADKPGGGP